MTHIFAIAAAMTLAGSVAAFAQGVTITETEVTVRSSAPAVEGTTVVAPPAMNPDQFTSAPRKVQTDEQGKVLVGAPLEVTASDSLPLSDDLDTLFVIDTGNVKPVGEWTAADRQACTAAGGIELEIVAGRIACFNL